MPAPRSRLRPLRTHALLALLTASGFALGPTTAAVAKDDVIEAPPVLVSTKGGGDSWSTIAELIEAAEAGNPIACFQYADLLETGHQELKADPAQALAYYAKAAAEDYAPALFRLGKINHEGLLGQPRNYDRAMAFYRRAAVAGSFEATHNVGAMYVSGRGVKRDYVEGLAWLLLANERGDDTAAIDQVKQRLRKRPDLIAAAEKRLPALKTELGAPDDPTATKMPGAATASAANPIAPPALTAPKPALDLPTLAPTQPSAPTTLPKLAPERPMIGIPTINLPPPPAPPAPAPPPTP